MYANDPMTRTGDVNSRSSLPIPIKILIKIGVHVTMKVVNIAAYILIEFICIT